MQNITITNFSEVSEYLYDEYLEYIKRIKIKFINANLELFLETIIQNEQIELLKYILKKCKYKKISTYHVSNILIRYKGKNHPEKILKILLNKYSDLSSYILETEGNFRDIALNSSLEFIKEIYKLKENTNMNISTIHIYNIKLYNFKDKRIFYWLLDNELIKLDYVLTDWLVEELTSSISEINSDNIDYLLEKINFNKSELKKIFTIKTSIFDKDRYLLNELIIKKKYNLIYYFFELLKPNEIIHKDADVIETIFKHIIMFSDYDMFMFLMKQIILLKYDDFLNDYFLNDYEYSKKCIGYSNTDKKIIYELVKLGAKVDKNLKYYNDYNNIQIVKNNS